jgi:hypothetical protein
LFILLFISFIVKYFSALKVISGGVDWLQCQPNYQKLKMFYVGFPGGKNFYYLWSGKIFQ